MSIFGLFEQRSLENPALPLTNSALLDFLGGVPLDAGVPVTEKTALYMPAVYRAVGLISYVSSSLPLHSFKSGTKDRTQEPLLDDPHPELTPCELWRQAYAFRALWGNAYIQKIRNGAGQVVELWPVSSDRTQVTRDKPEPGNPSGKYFSIVDDWGVHHVLTPREILHIPGLGYDGITGCSPVRLAAQGIGLAQAAEKSAARLFGSGNIVSGILQTEQRLEAGQADALKARWKAKMSGVHNAHDVAVLDSGASFKPVTMSYLDSQFLESRQFQIEEISRMWGVPPFLLMMTSKSTSWGTGLEQQVQGWVTFDLAPVWLTPTEQRISKELLPKGEEAKYAVQGLLRGDSTARANFYRVMREVGAFSANDIRAREDLPEIPDGDTYLQPLNLAPLGSNPNDPAAAPAT